MNGQRLIPMYLVWDPNNETEQDAIDRHWKYGSIDVANAAKQHVGYRAAARDWEEPATWPLVMRVRAVATGKLYDVAIDRQIHYSYAPAKPKEIG